MVQYTPTVRDGRVESESPNGPSPLPTVPATHSILDADALATLIARHYQLDTAVDVSLIRRGLNDVYQVASGSGRHILRVHRAGWHVDGDLYWERELLDHLASGGVSVTTVVPTWDDQPFLAVQAPEGRRQLMMFTFADGRLVREGRAKGSKPSVTEFPERYGALSARVHARADTFTSAHRRFSLDVEHLLWRPWRAIAPLLRQRRADHDRLLGSVRQLAARVEAMCGELEHGPCHGDLTGGNAVLEAGELTMFDFDSGGPGPRAYDLAVFAWSMRLQRAPAGTVDGFINGYRQVRRLRDTDLAALPVFEAVREVWFMGLQSENAPDWGYGLADDDFFDYRLGFLDEIVSEIQ